MIILTLTGIHGHMKKTKEQIIADLKLIDIVIEILDARVPLASQNPDIKDVIKNKKKIIVLNKADLADNNSTNKWIDFYAKEGIKAVAVESNTSKGIKDVIEAIKEEYSEIKEKFVQKGRIGKSIRVMVVGIPNVGKSTFINSIAKRNTAKVGNKPGVTKQKQWIKVTNEIELMDTPGMLWPKFEDNELAMHLAFVGTIGDNAIDKEEIAYYLLDYLIKNYPQRLIDRFDVEVYKASDEQDTDTSICNNDEKENNTSIENKGKKTTNTDKKVPRETMEVLEDIARKRGALLSGGNINMQKISDIILNEFQSGKLGRITIELPR